MVDETADTNSGDSEAAALANLNELLRQEFENNNPNSSSNNNSNPNSPSSSPRSRSKRVAAQHSAARLQYVKAISELRPDDYSYSLHEMQGDGTLTRRVFLEKQKSAARIKKRCDALREAWKLYDSAVVTADNDTNETTLAIDEEMKRDLEETEDELADDWIVFAQLIKEIEGDFQKELGASSHHNTSSEDGGTSDDGNDSDMEMWMEEAKRLKKEEQKKAAQRKKPGKQKRRSSKKGSFKLNDGDDSSSNKSASKKSSGKAKRRSSKTGLDLDDDAATNNKSKGGGKMKRRSSKKGLMDDDDDRSEKSDKEKKSKSKAKRRSSKTGLSPEDDDNNTTGGDTKKKSDKPKFRRRLSKKGLDDSKSYSSSPRITKKGTWSPASPSKVPTTNLDGTPYISQFRAWMNEPKGYKEVGSQVQIPTVPKLTNFWRDSELHYDNAPFFWHKVMGNFQVLVHVSGSLATRGDKAGLMARVDANTWMTCALEYHDDQLVHSTCITRDNVSDVSYIVLDKLNPALNQQITKGLYVSIKKIGSSYESYFSYSGQTWSLARQGLFNVESDWVRLGVFCACPSKNSYGMAFNMYRCESVLTSSSTET